MLDFVRFAAAKLFLDRFELFVEVILFLGALHLALHASVDRAIDVELLDFDFQDIRDAVQPLHRLEYLQQFLFFLHRNLEIRGDGVGKLAGIVHAYRCNHRVVIQALRELHVLLEKSGDALGGLLRLRRWLGLQRNEFERSAKESLVAGNLHDFGAFRALDQHFDVAVRQLHALHDVGERAHLIDFFRLRIVHGRIVLRDQKYLLVAGQRFFQRAHRGFAPHDERVHHFRENDHVPHRHHRHALHFEFFLAEHNLEIAVLYRELRRK